MSSGSWLGLGSLVVFPDLGNITCGASECACDDGVGVSGGKFKMNNL